MSSSPRSGNDNTSTMPTYGEVGAHQLERLCHGLDMERDLAGYRTIQDFMLRGWGDVPIPSCAPYPSAIGDDHTPFEYSIAFGGRNAELRLLIETQAERPGLVANQAAALACNQRLAERYGLDLRRFETVKDLFLAQNPQPPFSLWHAVCFVPGKAPEFKLYLNPEVRGAEAAPALVLEAMDRLGFGQAIRPLLKRMTWRGPHLDQFNYFSLDLSNSASARVKVYLRHLDATASDLERTFAAAPSHRPGDLLNFCRATAGQAGPFREKPVSSCFSFVQGNGSPSAVTFHFPIAHYVANDAVTAARVGAYLASNGLRAETYQRALSAFADRPLEDGVGIQSYASYRREESGIRFTAYLSPELFRGAGDERSQTRLRAHQPARRLPARG